MLKYNLICLLILTLYCEKRNNLIIINKENVNKLKKANEIISKLQKEKFELEEKIKLGIIERVDSANSTEKNSNLTMAIETFTESQNSFKELMDKRGDIIKIK